MAAKNSSILAPRGAPPEMQNWMRPPIRPRTLAPTSRSAIADVNASTGPGERPAKRALAARRPCSSPQKKMLRRSGGWVLAFSITRACTFSKKRGTPISTVGRTSAASAATVSMLCA